MNFVHGQKCTCIIDGREITDAKISIDDKNYIYIYICQNNINGNKTKELFEYDYSWCLKGDIGFGGIFDLKLFPLEEEFTRGELVEVRDSEDEEWIEKTFIAQIKDIEFPIFVIRNYYEKDFHKNKQENSTLFLNSY
jgi:hypothetical protein